MHVADNVRRRQQAAGSNAIFSNYSGVKLVADAVVNSSVFDEKNLAVALFRVNRVQLAVSRVIDVQPAGIDVSRSIEYALHTGSRSRTCRPPALTPRAFFV